MQCIFPTYLWGSSSFVRHLLASPSIVRHLLASPSRISFGSTTISMHRLLPPVLLVAWLSAFSSCFPSRIGDFCLPFLYPSPPSGVKCDGQFLADLLLGTASGALGEAHEAAAKEHFGEQPPLISHSVRQFVQCKAYFR